MKALEDPDLSADQRQLLTEIQGIRQVVINEQHGGFGLSDRAWRRYCELGGLDPMDENLNDYDIVRDDPDLIRVIEELGQQANGRFAKLKIVEIPSDVKWQIDEYDGLEWVAECHRTWR
jgi:hypothetical protein